MPMAGNIASVTPSLRGVIELLDTRLGRTAPASCRQVQVFVRLAIQIVFILLLPCMQYVSAADGVFPRLDEARLGATTPGNAELQALFSPLHPVSEIYDPNLAWLFSPRPLIGASISLRGKTSEAYAGLAWTLPVYGPFSVELSAGGLVHDQKLDQNYSDRPSPLSTHVLFRESIAIGYDINESWRILAFAAHGSNGKLGYRNESVNRYGVLLGNKIGPSDRKLISTDSIISNFSWAGLYGGFGVGVAAGNYNLLSPNPTDVTAHSNSVNLAAQVGYNWVFGRFVLGSEVDYSVQGVNGSANVNASDSAFVASSFWLVTARGRLGTEVNIPFVSPRSLIYATGGAAFSRIANGYCLNASVQCYVRPNMDIGGGWSDQGAVRTGWTAGAGIELPLAARVTAKFEYLYVDFGRFGFTNGAVSNEISFSEHILRTGMNLKFN
jgi:opacity protein-like surface antigen